MAEEFHYARHAAPLRISACVPDIHFSRKIELTGLAVCLDSHKLNSHSSLTPAKLAELVKTMEAVLARALNRLQIAHHILEQLQLLEKWSAFGLPVLVGAAAYGLVVAPDIDLEIFCAEPRIEDGFEILRACALHPQVRKARFANELNGPDRGLYWQLRYRAAEGQEWKIDMWSMRHDHPGPTSAALVEPLKRALTDATRRTILELKEQIQAEMPGVCGSIYVYRAVLDDGIRDLEQFEYWLRHAPPQGLMQWTPQER